MNKFFVLALFALVAACAAAPAELKPEAAKAVDAAIEETAELDPHAQDKRSIMISTAGLRYYPEYEYRYPSVRYATSLSYPTVPSLTYPYNPYFGRYIIA